MTMKIEYDPDSFGFSVSTPLDTTSSAKWTIEMKINFEITSNAGGSATARQSIVFKSAPISFTSQMLFGDSATLSTEPLPGTGRQAVRR